MASPGFSQQESMFLEFSLAPIPPVPLVHLEVHEYRGRWVLSSLSTMAVSLFFHQTPTSTF